MVRSLFSLWKYFDFPCALAVLNFSETGFSNAVVDEVIELKKRGAELDLSATQQVIYFGDYQLAYPWMSVSKLLTSRVILAAVEHGVFSLDQGISELLGSQDLPVKYWGSLTATVPKKTDFKFFR